ncbi:MAG: undecaprenyl-phosphate glucose phosphotransferase [Tannerella sp.]|jgi:putative colanic acid biosynthesis UDP-glucose lipid carrier transferase|nr:undecaprenyl-phosphate glucose phosphotransferase [Tannerella sp.]
MEQNNKQGGGILQWIIGAGDLIILNALFFAIYYEMDSSYTRAITRSLREVVLLLNFCYFFALYFVPIKLHQSVVFLDKIVQRSFMLISFQTFLFATCLIFLNAGNDLATFIVVFYVATVLGFSLWRVLVRLAVKIYRRKGYNSKSIIIVGAGKNGMELYRVIKNDLSYGFNVLGFFDDNELLKDVLPNYLGRINDMQSFVLEHQVDEIYCTIPGTSSEKISGLLSFAEKNMIRFYIIPEFYRDVKKSMILDIMESIPLLSIRNEPLQSAYNRAIKRAFDIVFSVLVLLTCYPLLYLIAGFLIKRSSPGPILFKQKRTGIYGQIFECYKFRTMRMNKDADFVQAVKDDPRTTKIGSFLRRTNLDEFPQFVNVLIGNMSVVGPRPHMLKHTELYSQLVDKYMVRHLVKPGITGWAQIMGYRGETRTLEQMEGRVKRDVWYIENWSFFLDLKIVFVTIVNMFKGEKNAY